MLLCNHSDVLPPFQYSAIHLHELYISLTTVGGFFTTLSTMKMMHTGSRWLVWAPVAQSQSYGRMVGRYLTITVLGLPILFMMGLIAWNTIPYFTEGASDPFFIEKGETYRNPLWRIAFYLHISFGMICLFAPILQFSKWILNKHPALHRRLGGIYVHTTLWLVAPTGMYLAIYAKGGRWGAILFSILGVLHFYFTLMGWLRMRGPQPDVRSHAAWMIRSYLMAQSAVSFRVFHLLLMVVGVANFYIHALWMSLVFNLLLAEGLVGIINLKRKMSNR